MVGPRVLAAIVAAVLVAACADDPTSADDPTAADATVETPSPASSPTAIETIDEPSVVLALDLAYDTESDHRVLDVHVPQGDGPFPTILAVHGGGFFAGDKRDYERHAPYFVERGIAFVSVNYGLTPSTTHPGQIEDLHCALAWVHAHADRHGFDPSHIVALGASAGGHLVAMLATADDHDVHLTDCPHELPAEPLAGAVPMYGVIDFTVLESDGIPPGLLGAASRLAGAPYPELAPDLLAGMSPIEQVDGSEPPILAIHGTLDQTIPSEMSERFVEALRTAGVDAELLLVEAPHAFDFVQPFEMPPTDEVLTAIEQFVADAG